VWGHGGFAAQFGRPLMPGELHDLSVAIGGLQAQVKTLTHTVERNQETATEEHRKVHDIVVAMSGAVRILTADVAEMKPLTAAYREERAEKRATKRIRNFLFVTCGGVVGAIGAKLLDLINIKPPH
jgi:hypothetical protein